MKILSTGDWHFNAGFDEDVLSSVNQIVEFVSIDRIDLVVITGDVYERASDPSSRNLAAECIQKIANECPVIIVRGNHDAPGDLNILMRIEAGNMIRVNEAPDRIVFGEVIIHTLPWLTKSRWQALNPEASKEEGDKTVSQMVLEYLRNSVSLHSEYKNILAAHLTVAGARAEKHQQMGADGVTVGLYDIGEAGFFAAMLGHIHLRQEIGGPKYFYNGSIAPLDYGESPDKYFSVLDTETGDVGWVRLNTIHRQDVEAEWAPTGIKVNLEDVFVPGLKGARIRANLRVEGGDNTETAKKQLADWMKSVGALEYQINPQVIPVSRVRSVEISKSAALSDKLKRYWEATESPDLATQNDMLKKLEQLEDECSL